MGYSERTLGRCDSDGPGVKEVALGVPIMFWSSDSWPQDYEDAARHVSAGRVGRVVEILKEGSRVIRYRGAARCRICGRLLGSSSMVGFGFVWPEGAEHYVSEHGVWMEVLDTLVETAEQVEGGSGS